VRGLLVQLSALDPGAESAVRIIDFFDGLTRNRANVDALVRAAAGLADCPTGLRDKRGNVLAHYGPRGRPITTPAPEDGLVERGFGNSTAGGTVWLERPDGEQPLDAMVIERMAVAADIILDRRRRTEGPLRDDPLLIRTLINARSRDLDKAEAARVMGLTGDVIVLAARLAVRDTQRLLRLAHSLEHDLGRPVRVAAIDESTDAFVVDGAVGDRLAKLLEGSMGTADRVGIGSRRPPSEAHLSWRSANQALVFATAGASAAVVSSDDLGPVALLASLARADMAEEPDVVALRGLAQSRGGRDVITTLECLVRTRSIRQVSTALHMHHSSIASRIRRAEAALDYGLDSPDALFRAHLALEMWRIVNSDSETSDPQLARSAD
jgi:hypothetical protein